MHYHRVMRASTTKVSVLSLKSQNAIRVDRPDADGEGQTFGPYNNSCHTYRTVYRRPSSSMRLSQQGAILSPPAGLPPSPCSPFSYALTPPVQQFDVFYQQQQQRAENRVCSQATEGRARRDTHTKRQRKQKDARSPTWLRRPGFRGKDHSGCPSKRRRTANITDADLAQSHTAAHQVPRLARRFLGHLLLVRFPPFPCPCLTLLN